MTFFDSLEHMSRKKDSLLCVGIDPDIPRTSGSYTLLYDYGRRIVDACAPYACAFKPQSAFFERHGAEGWRALDALVQYIQSINEHFPVIFDAKRGDIGSTAAAYASAFLDRPGCLAITLSPYLGRESAVPFLDKPGAGIFVLCRTTNPGAERLQERQLESGEPVYLAVAEEVSRWGGNLVSGSTAGLVVAGNKPHILSEVRQRHPHIWILAPGIGAQGGVPEQAVSSGTRSDAFGLLVSASRSIANDPNPGTAAMKTRDVIRSAQQKKLKAGSPAVVPAGQDGQTPLHHSSGHRSKINCSSGFRRDFIVGLFDSGAFRTGTFKLKSGQTSPFYIDLRRLSSVPSLLDMAGVAFAELVEHVHPVQLIAGIPVAALALAASASLRTGLGLIYPRMKQKAHGSGAVIEGIWEEGDTAVLLDDLITTGESKVEALALLRRAGLVVNDLVVLIERGRQGRADMEQVGIRLHSWLRLEELVSVGLEKKYISSTTSDILLQYLDEH